MAFTMPTFSDSCQQSNANTQKDKNLTSLSTLPLKEVRVDLEHINIPNKYTPKPANINNTDKQTNDAKQQAASPRNSDASTPQSSRSSSPLSVQRTKFNCRRSLSFEKFLCSTSQRKQPPSPLPSQNDREPLTLRSEYENTDNNGNENRNSIADDNLSLSFNDDNDNRIAPSNIDAELMPSQRNDEAVNNNNANETAANGNNENDDNEHDQVTDADNNEELGIQRTYKRTNEFILDCIFYYENAREGDAFQEKQKRYTVTENGEIYLGENISIDRTVWEFMHVEKPSYFIVTIAKHLWGGHLRLANRAFDLTNGAKNIPGRSPVKLVEKNVCIMTILKKNKNFTNSERAVHLNQAIDHIRYAIRNLRAAEIKKAIAEDREAKINRIKRKKLRYNYQGP
ncbi:probable WRKY transcription factor protein 1 isoform X1 [Nasonia vitripennis]|uniref:Uncharacterized protein n=1 Tax=Nasonia vitripennis TaxID=7425 RepID=A0A7M7QQD4_NASVI|nr:probable WRKY transcription factor protein 1 isoform X1 [Nasonia vitripennis]XP_031789312.1 probable WRKY transcription factor protein 1 isoform X1 [Nasonia vitripennis]